MKINQLTVLLVICIGLSNIACSQDNQTSSQANSNQAVSNQTAFSQPDANQSKETEIPSGIKKSRYDRNADEENPSLSLNNNKEIYFKDKLMNDAALKDILKDFAAKTKKIPPTKSMPAYLLDDNEVNPFYLKADVRLSFSEVIKLLKTVQESSPNQYRVKFVVNPAEEVGKAIQTPNGKSFISVDLGMAAPKTDDIPKPNPLLLVARLDAAGKIKLNNEPPMEISALKAFLSNLIKEREQNGVFAEGTNEIEKKITLVTEPDVKYGDVIKLISELYGMYATHVEFGELSNMYQSRAIKISDEPRKVENSGSQGEGTGRGSGSGTVPKP